MILKLLLYTLSTFVLTVALAIFQQKIQLSFEKISLPQLSLALGVILFFFLFRGTLPTISIYFDEIILMKSFFAFILPLILFIVVYVISKLLGIDVSMNENIFKMLPIAVVGMLIGAIGEEIGWRSFMQPSLENKFTILTASIIVGLVWGIWHMGHYKNGWIFMCGFLLFTISASIIITWLFRDTAYNLIISSIFHFSVNIGFLIFFYNSLTNSKLMLTNGLVWLVFAFIILVTNRSLFINTPRLEF